ncbi:hypothetical protein DFQ01_108143 [Paenibacillus cellulosilyticus]|uniref:YdhG-like domain-containing protein n=1 Tax=Paenibacillus cellulosilyticus TaxID=375489 RepID=A0A2V2YW72_9BACL|nr:DUF1801 domain-containing protein [Paenibacillus cellulosilyticus]PWW02866.1 hypothetical protein DFQ01_108143 [Paenibacillus cellulosilyticus]QKS45780.1 DUF1801 domain-containing protein [Paenibacillus cellulosilyticus]
MSQEVIEFIEKVKEPWQASLCHELRQVVHNAIPDVQERMQYNKPHFLRNKKYAAVISTSKDAVSFTIFNATELELPEGLFDGPPERKTIKFRSGQQIDKSMLNDLVKQASSTL